MEILHLLAGPLVGAVIGYFTNYLAVKMLFHPYEEVKLGSFVLPFTPGIIPKRRGHLAKALGRVVGDELLTGADMKALLLSEEMETRVADSVMRGLESEEYGSVHRALGHFVGEETYQEKKEFLSGKLCEIVCQEINKLDISTMIVREGTRAILEKTKGTMLEMFLNEKVIASMAGPVGDCIADYIRSHGPEIVAPVIQEKAEYFTEKPFTGLLEDWQIEPEQVRQAVRSVYHQVIENQLEKAVEKLHVAAIVEDKINAMSTAGLEQLLLSVMKKELSALVNLGAVIGFVIGIINCFL